MKFVDLLPAFDVECARITGEMMKTAYAVGPKKQTLAEKVDRHLYGDNKDWAQFEKDMRGKKFRQAVIGHQASDEKLKAYVKAMGDYQSSKKVVGVVPSKTDPTKLYKVKDIGGRLGCGCKDWQYKHSHGGGDCQHIRELAQGLKEKVSGKKCVYCSSPATVKNRWAEGRAVVLTCDRHIEKAKQRIAEQGDKVFATVKLSGVALSLARGVALARVREKAKREQAKGKAMKENVMRLRAGAPLIPVKH